MRIYISFITLQYYNTFTNLLLAITMHFASDLDITATIDKQRDVFTKLTINLRPASHAFWLVSIPHIVQHNHLQLHVNLHCFPLSVRGKRTNFPVDDSATHQSIERLFRPSPLFANWKVSQRWIEKMYRMLIFAVSMVDPRRTRILS